MKKFELVPSPHLQQDLLPTRVEVKAKGKAKAKPSSLALSGQDGMAGPIGRGSRKSIQVPDEGRGERCRGSQFLKLVSKVMFEFAPTEW